MQTTSFSQNNHEYERAHFIDNQDSLNYRILKPLDFDKSKKYPLILFMHGSGERGNDNEAQLIHGADLFAKKENREKYPAFVVFPQCPKDDYWAHIDYTHKENGLGFGFKKAEKPLRALELVIKLLDSLIEHPNIDKNRVYISGLSMGGMAIFELLWRKPEIFAAALPICGGGAIETVKEYAKTIPVWVFHGASDNVVSPKYSIVMVQALLDAGGSPRFSLYDNTGHDSWTNAFAEPDFLEWMFSKKKN